MSSTGGVAEVVGRAVDVAALEAAAGQPEGEAVAVVVAAVGPLRDRQPAELARPEDDRRVEQPALLQVADQGRAGLVGPGAERLEGLGVLAVRVPGLAAQEELDEPDAALDQAAGDQAARAVLAGGRVVQAVHPADRRGLAGEVERPRGRPSASARRSRSWRSGPRARCCRDAGPGGRG